MGDHATFSNEDTFAKGKGKADPTNEMSMDDDSSSDSEPELVVSLQWQQSHLTNLKLT